MATFKYISKDMSAKTIRGTLEADDRNDLVRKLKEQNLFLVSCQDVTKKTVNQYKMKLNELSAYSREIGTMLFGFIFASILPSFYPFKDYLWTYNIDK